MIVHSRARNVVTRMSYKKIQIPILQHTYHQPSFLIVISLLVNVNMDSKIKTKNTLFHTLPFHHPLITLLSEKTQTNTHTHTKQTNTMMILLDNRIEMVMIEQQKQVIQQKQTL